MITTHPSRSPCRSTLHNLSWHSRPDSCWTAPESRWRRGSKHSRPLPGRAETNSPLPGRPQERYPRTRRGRQDPGGQHHRDPRPARAGRGPVASGVQHLRSASALRDHSGDRPGNHRPSATGSRLKAGRRRHTDSLPNHPERYSGKRKTAGHNASGRLHPGRPPGPAPGHPARTHPRHDRIRATDQPEQTPGKVSRPPPRRRQGLDRTGNDHPRPQLAKPSLRPDDKPRSTSQSRRQTTILFNSGQNSVSLHNLHTSLPMGHRIW